MSSENPEVELIPSKECDIVMKGGITSGLVYPKAIFEIAQKFKFKSIGGTSAGAIAAGLTAAAEYRRTNGDVDGFNILSTLPDILSKVENKQTKLISLFAPNNTTGKYYNTLLPLMSRKSKKSAITYLVLAILKSYPIITLGFLLGYVILEYFAFENSLTISILYSLINILFFLILNLLINAGYFIYKFNNDLKSNNFGLTTGYGFDKKDKSSSLTDWLSELIDKVSGKNESGPLTFGDLYDYEQNTGIDLKVVTTNLNHGVPVTLPLQIINDKPFYYFKKEDMSMYFPEKVVNLMVEKSMELTEGLYALPDAKDLPIIVAVRMSLSFPVLISAVPLYIRDYLTEYKTNSVKPIINKSWFSDGGICSNFPIHFFDAPLPTHPTFAINLRPFKKGQIISDDQQKNIFMPEDNGEGLEYEWNYNDESLMKFLSSITKTMQNWNDNSLMRIPGYRDRICHIYLSNTEGGLNLNMPQEFINNICERGKFAGIELRDRFSGVKETKMDWDNHKWIRFRTTILLMDKFLTDFMKSYEDYPHEDELSYKDLVNRDNDDPPESYKLNNNKQKEFILAELQKLADIVKEWDVKDSIKTLSGRNVPRPKPDLKVKPKL